MNVLIGTAIGDALGMPFETRSANDPFLLSWDGESFLESEFHNLKPGQWTDDCQMTCMVAQSLIENQGFNPDDLSKRYVHWIKSGEARGYGKTTLLAVQRLDNGTHWSASGVEGSWGNGTAMRAAPFGVYFRHDIKSLVEAVKIDSNITHKSDDAEAGALAIALASYYLINDQDEDLIAKIVDQLPASEIKRILSCFPEIMASKVSPFDILKIIGTKAKVQETVPAALYCFLKFKTFKEAVNAAIRSGNDTDTTGACVGALYGAKHGLKGIDKKFYQVEDFDKLLNLDAQLFSGGSGMLFPKV